ncbi:MAG: SdpI family protein [Syntrophomonadaceae bacterium]|nr:SdpI family protein [Syntrophomonadaceae bacterium]
MNDNNGALYSLDWKSVKREWPLWVLMLGLVISAFLVYPHLPEQVPSHWNIHGEVDGYSSRAFGAFFMPFLAILMYLLLLFLPLLDPRRDNYPRFSKAYTFLRWSLVVFFSILYGVTILVALGYDLNVGMIVKAMVAVLLIIIGNYMGQFRHNYFVGIRTPWTLANEEVWQRTHRMGSRIWVLGGFLCLAMAPVNTSWAGVVFFAAIILMALIPAVYSFIIFARLRSSN